MTMVTIDWAAAWRPMPGEEACGDQYCVVRHPSGIVLGVIDGLGHGEDAAAAAEIACREVRHHAAESVINVVQRCHQALIGSRGAAMSLARFDTDDRTLTWVGVGNVDGIALRHDGDGQTLQSRLLTRGGVVGSALPALRAAVLPIGPGDLFVFATDGIADEFGDDLRREPLDPTTLANHLLARHAKPTDDALVVVATAVPAPGAA